MSKAICNASIFNIDNGIFFLKGEEYKIFRGYDGCAFITNTSSITECDITIDIKDPIFIAYFSIIGGKEIQTESDYYKWLSGDRL